MFAYLDRDNLSEEDAAEANQLMATMYELEKTAKPRDDLEWVIARFRWYLLDEKYISTLGRKTRKVEKRLPAVKAWLQVGDREWSLTTDYEQIVDFAGNTVIVGDEPAGKITDRRNSELLALSSATESTRLLYNSSRVIDHKPDWWVGEISALGHHLLKWPSERARFSARIVALAPQVPIVQTEATAEECELYELELCWDHWCRNMLGEIPTDQSILDSPEWQERKSKTKLYKYTPIKK